MINRFNPWYVERFECSTRFVNFVLGSVIMESTRPEAGTKGAGDSDPWSMETWADLSYANIAVSPTFFYHLLDIIYDRFFSGLGQLEQQNM